MSALRVTDYTADECEAAKARALAKFGSDRIVQVSLGPPRPYKVLLALFTRASYATYIDTLHQLKEQGVRLTVQDLLLEPNPVALFEKVPGSPFPLMTQLRAFAGTDGLGLNSKKPSVNLLECFPEGVPDLGLTAETVKELREKAGSRDLFLARLDYNVLAPKGKIAVEVPYGFVMSECDAAIFNQASASFNRASSACSGIIESYRDLVSECVVWAAPTLTGSTSFATHEELFPGLIQEAWGAFLAIGGAATAQANKRLPL